MGAKRLGSLATSSTISFLSSVLSSLVVLGLALVMSGLVDFLSFALKSTIGEDSAFVVVAAAPCGSVFEPEAVDFSD